MTIKPIDNGLVEVTDCPVCYGKSLTHGETVYTAPYLMVDFVGGSLPMATVASYLKCERCGLAMLSPRMNDARIEQYYSSGAYRQTLGLTQEAMDADELKRATELIAWLKENQIRPNFHVDIGASRGYFADATEREFGSVSGGLDLNNSYGHIKAIVIASHADADLVTAIHVLEHTVDPVKSLREWVDLTTKYLLIEVPGVGCKGGPLRWAHNYYFPRELLEQMITAAGCDIAIGQETAAHHTRILAIRKDK